MYISTIPQPHPSNHQHFNSVLFKIIIIVTISPLRSALEFIFTQAAAACVWKTTLTARVPT